MKTFDEILKDSLFRLVERREVILCSQCGGSGFYTEEVCVDYHRDDYKTVRHKCKPCKGDGRMVQTVRKIDVRISEERKIQSYVDFGDDPHVHTSDHVRLIIDKRNLLLEHKYPELKKASYDNYDALLEKYKLLEIMKKENKTW
jgi:hypothetical protein